MGLLTVLNFTEFLLRLSEIVPLKHNIWLMVSTEHNIYCLLLVLILIRQCHRHRAHKTFLSPAEMPRLALC